MPLLGRCIIGTKTAGRRETKNGSETGSSLPVAGSILGRVMGISPAVAKVLIPELSNKSSYSYLNVVFVEKFHPKTETKCPDSIFLCRRFLVMDDEKKMTLVLTLSDIAEGINTTIEALRLIANGLDDVANLLRETVTTETV